MNESELAKAYHVILAIPPEEQPPNHYRLLALALWEANPEVISNAYEARMVQVRNNALGKYAEASQVILNQMAKARLCLLKPAEKAAYDAELKRSLPPSGGSSIELAPPSEEDLAEQSALSQLFGQTAAPSPAPSSLGNRAAGSSISRPTRPSGITPAPVKPAATVKPAAAGAAGKAGSQTMVWAACGGAAVLAMGLFMVWFFTSGSSAPGSGTLEFDWDDAARRQAVLEIDGQRQIVPATGPIQFKLPAGEHHVRASRTGFERFDRRITIAAQGVVRLPENWVPSSSIALEWPLGSRAGAKLEVDGRTIPLAALSGSGDTLNIPVPPGNARLKITRPGYRPIERAFTVTTGIPQRLAVSWVPDTSTTPAGVARVDPFGPPLPVTGVSTPAGSTGIAGPTGSAGLTSPAGDSSQNSGWIDLTASTSLQKDVLGSSWERSPEGKVRSIWSKYAQLSLPIEVHGAYECDMELTVDEGPGRTVLILPIVGGKCLFVVFANDGNGIQPIDNTNYRTSPARNPTPALVLGRRHYVHASIHYPTPDTVSLDVSVDSQPYLAWSGELTRVVREWPDWIAVFLDPPAARPTIGSHTNRLTLHSMRVKPKSSEFAVLPADRDSILRRGLTTEGVAGVLAHWSPGWQLTPNPNGVLHEHGIVLIDDRFGRKNVLALHPWSNQNPIALTANVAVPAQGPTTLVMTAGRHREGDYRLVVKADGQTVHDQPVDAQSTTEYWQDVAIDLSRFAGRKIPIQLEVHPTGWAWEWAYFMPPEFRHPTQGTVVPAPVPLAASSEAGLKGWDYFGGAWSADADGVVRSENAGHRHAICEYAPFSDGIITFEVCPNTAHVAHLLFRISDVKHGSDQWRSYSVSVHGAHEVRLTRHEFNWKTLKGVRRQFTPDEWIALRIEAQGDRIRIWVGDEREPVIDFTDPDPIAAGVVGLRSSGKSAWRNLQVISGGKTQKIDLSLAAVEDYGRELSMPAAPGVAAPLATTESDPMSSSSADPSADPADPQPAGRSGLADLIPKVSGIPDDKLRKRLVLAPERFKKLTTADIEQARTEASAVENRAPPRQRGAWLLDEALAREPLDAVSVALLERAAVLCDPASEGAAEVDLPTYFAARRALAAQQNAPVEPALIAEYRKVPRYAKLPRRGTLDLPSLLDQHLLLLEEALLLEHFDFAREICDDVREQSSNGKLPLYTRFVVEKRSEWTARRKARDEVQAAVERLTASPADAEAAALVGRHRALVLHDWTIGVPLLASGSASPLATAARLEATQPRSSDAQSEAANAWLIAARAVSKDSELDRLLRAACFRRALLWYTSACTQQSSLKERYRGELSECRRCGFRWLLPYVSLTELKPVQTRVGWDRFRVNTPYVAPPVINSVPCLDYLFAHAASMAEYDVPEGATGFTAVGYCTESKDVDFRIEGLAQPSKGPPTGVQLGNTGKAGIAPIQVEFREPMLSLFLHCDTRGSGYGDHSYWCYPRFIRQP